MKKQFNENRKILNNEKVVSVVVHAYYLEDTRVRKQCEELAKNNYTVTVYCLRYEGEVQSESVNGVDIYRCNVQRKRINRTKVSYILEYLSFFIKSSLSVTRASFKNKPDLLIVHNMPNFLVFTGLFLKLRSIPILLDVHDLMPEIWDMMESKKTSLLKRLLFLEESISHTFATKLMTVNRPIAKYLKERTSYDYEVIHNGPLNYAPVETEERLFENRFKLVFHGNIHERYGLHHLIKILPLLKNKYPLLTLDVHGYGPYLQNIEDLCQELDVMSYCRIHGRFKPDDVADILKGKSLGFVVADKSTQHDLAIPVKLTEYVNNGIPVICTALKTTVEYFDSNSILYFDNHDELFEKVCFALDHYSIMQEMVRKAQANVKSICWLEEKSKFINIVEKVMENVK